MSFMCDRIIARGRKPILWTIIKNRLTIFMEHNPQQGSETIPHPSADFRNMPHDSEPFSTVKNDAERFRSVPQISERKESHTLTVREVARMFEAAGVARTERSIVNWCQPSRTGIPRLDSYFDPNERRYFISPQSVDQAIAEEKAKGAKANEVSAPMGATSHGSETRNTTRPFSETDNFNVRELERENHDLRITNQVKDMFIEQLKNDQKGFVSQLLAATHKVGVLETKLLQIEAPTRFWVEGPESEAGMKD